MTERLRVTWTVEFENYGADLPPPGDDEFAVFLTDVLMEHSPLIGAVQWGDDDDPADLQPVGWSVDAGPYGDIQIGTLMSTEERAVALPYYDENGHLQAADPPLADVWLVTLDRDQPSVIAAFTVPPTDDELELVVRERWDSEPWRGDEGEAWLRFDVERNDDGITWQVRDRAPGCCDHDCDGHLADEGRVDTVPLIR